MKNFYLFSILNAFFAFISILVSAQENYTPGYVITLNKDTLKGKINNREWNINPSAIQFQDTTGKTTLFKPDEIAGFFVAPRDKFISCHVSLDLTSFQTQDLIDHKPQKAVKDTAVFLMVLVKGKASLYYLKDRNNREHYYVSTGNVSPMELIIRKTYIVPEVGNTNEKSHVATVELFKGQLIVLFSDCKEMMNSINISNYSKISLTKLVIKYNVCQKSPVEYVRKGERLKIKFGLLAAPCITKINFGRRGVIDYGVDDVSGMKLKDCYSFLAGASFHLIFPRQLAQWSLVNELVYKSYSSSGMVSGYTSDYIYYVNSLTLKMSYLKLYTMIRYQIPKRKFRPFADIGMSNTYSLKVEDNETTMKKFNDFVWNGSTTPFYPSSPRKLQIGALCGIGASWWKISGEIRYEWTQGLSPIGLGCPENTFFFVVSFLF